MEGDLVVISILLAVLINASDLMESHTRKFMLDVTLLSLIWWARYAHSFRIMKIE
jgi:hypothetical protein